MSDNTLKNTKTNTAIKGFLRINQVAELLQVGVSTIWFRIACGEFPQPVKIGPRTTVFFEDEVLAFIESFRKTGAAGSSTSLKSLPGFIIEKPTEPPAIVAIHGVGPVKRCVDIHNIDETSILLKTRRKPYK